MRLVLDASAAVNALVPGHLRNATLRHFDGAELFAPALIDTEVVSALARLERAELITTPEAGSAVTAWTRLPCTKLETEPTIPAIWALRHAVRVSDAHYAVVARLLDAPLLTADVRLGRAHLPGVSVLTIG